MRISLFVSGLLLLIVGVASGETIFTAPCEQGGSISVDSSGFSYDPSTGAFSITFQVDNCGVDEFMSVNGRTAISGTYRILSETMAQIEANSEINAEVTDSGKSRSVNCAGRLSGTYNFSDEVFDGDMNITHCSGSGRVGVHFLDLLVAGPIHLIP